MRRPRVATAWARSSREVRSREVRSPEVRGRQVRGRQVRFRQVRAYQVRFRQVQSLQLRARQQVIRDAVRLVIDLGDSLHERREPPDAGRVLCIAGGCRLEAREETANADDGDGGDEEEVEEEGHEGVPRCVPVAAHREAAASSRGLPHRQRVCSSDSTHQHPPYLPIPSP